MVKMTVFICFFAVVTSLPATQRRSKRSILYNIINGVLNCQHDRNRNMDMSSLSVGIYDFANDVQMFHRIGNAPEALMSYRNMRLNKKIIVYVGGFESTINCDSALKIRDAYKNVRNSILIILDHSIYSHSMYGLKAGYERSVRNTYHIGTALGDMLGRMHRRGVRPENIHVIGFSLGGQLLAHTGIKFYLMTGKFISRITALDPAGPCFSSSSIINQVRTGVAEYVEIYHCSMGELGSSKIHGDVDFILNGGVEQPGCGDISPVTVAECSHYTCLDFWTASVQNPCLFKAYRCRTRNCGVLQINDEIVAGFNNTCEAKGIYHVSTRLININACKR